MLFKRRTLSQVLATRKVRCQWQWRHLCQWQCLAFLSQRFLYRLVLIWCIQYTACHIGCLMYMRLPLRLGLVFYCRIWKERNIIMKSSMIIGNWILEWGTAEKRRKMSFKFQWLQILFGGPTQSRWQNGPAVRHTCEIVFSCYGLCKLYMSLMHICSSLAVFSQVKTGRLNRQTDVRTDILKSLNTKPSPFSSLQKVRSDCLLQFLFNDEDW